MKGLGLLFGPAVVGVLMAGSIILVGLILAPPVVWLGRNVLGWWWNWWLQ